MIVTASHGDSVDKLCHRHLGVTAQITEQVLELNPGLATLGPILPMGTQVELPDTAPQEAETVFIQLWD